MSKIVENKEERLKRAKEELNPALLLGASNDYEEIKSLETSKEAKAEIEEEFKETEEVAGETKATVAKRPTCSGCGRELTKTKQNAFGIDWFCENCRRGFRDD